jgi:uridine nucleosidase
MLFDLLVFFASTYESVFGLTSGPPLHDPLAVAVVLSTLNPTFPKQHPGQALKFDDRNGERFTVDVVTEGLHGTDAELAGALGQSRVTPTEQGVAIPRGVDLAAFWDLILLCLQRADDCNAARKKAC